VIELLGCWKLLEHARVIADAACAWRCWIGGGSRLSGGALKRIGMLRHCFPLFHGKSIVLCTTATAMPEGLGGGRTDNREQRNQGTKEPRTENQEPKIGQPSVPIP
jgi:hypothetical protein